MWAWTASTREHSPTTVCAPPLDTPGERRAASVLRFVEAAQTKVLESGLVMARAVRAHMEAKAGGVAGGAAGTGEL